MTANNEDFERRARADLRRLVDGTSPALRARIAAVTSGAIEQSGSPRRKLWPVLVPVGSMAAVAVVAVVAMSSLEPGRVEPTRPPPIAADDVALLLNVDNLDLLEQMEFYLWVDRESGALDATGASASELPQRS
jgi:hypothetical protein